MKYFILSFLLVVLIAFSCESDAQTIQQTEANVIGKRYLEEVPWWLDALSSIKLKGGIKIGDIINRKHDTTVPLSMRMSARISQNMRVKLRVSDESNAEIIRYSTRGREYYYKQTTDAGEIGWRVRW